MLLYLIEESLVTDDRFHRTPEPNVKNLSFAPIFSPTFVVRSGRPIETGRSYMSTSDERLSFPGGRAREH